MFITARDLSTDIARWSGVVEEKKSKLLTLKLIENLLTFFGCCIVLTLASLLISVELLKNLIVGFTFEPKKGDYFLLVSYMHPMGFVSMMSPFNSFVWAKKCILRWSSWAGKKLRFAIEGISFGPERQKPSYYKFRIPLMTKSSSCWHLKAKTDRTQWNP